jgi:hypothetical protein
MAMFDFMVLFFNLLTRLWQVGCGLEALNRLHIH